LAYVEPARNFAISKATGDWVLILDADEEVSDTLANKIKEAIKENTADYYRIPRKNIIFNHWMKYSRWWPDYNVRLFKKGAVIWNEIIHAVPVTNGISGEFEDKEEVAILHNHYNTIEQYLERMNRYTSQQVKNKLADGYIFKWIDLIGKPINEFFSRYFFGQGYKDGIYGLSVSLLQSFSELVLYLKIWQEEKFKEHDVNLTDVIKVLKIKEKELHYWQNDALYKETGNVVARIKRKLQF
jgi:(heptosyl)LPS beta-1,4-glucosyltransferase